MIGQTLSHYKILDKLGEGGMGAVYLAEDMKLKRRVALKVLAQDLTADSQRLERFQREAESLAALDHPNIVTVFSVEEADGVHFLTMAYVEGRTLDQLIPPGGLSLERLLELAAPLADGLRAAHEQGIVHRDLKPGNVMVDGEDRLRVLDFGLAKLQPEAASPEMSQLPTQLMTQEGAVVGTYPYMSPEQAEGKTVDARSDIFSLGVILYEMATGKRPFRGETAAAVTSSILKDTPPPVTEERPELPRHLGRIIQHGLEKDPQQRFQTALDVRNELEGLKKETESGVTVPPGLGQAPTRPRRGRWWVAAGAAVALVIGLWAYQQRSPPEPTPPEAEPRADARPAARQKIVVLPFENLGAPEDDYFAAGLTEELTSRLAVVGGLGVISRTSAVQYDRTRKTLPQIGEDLGVEYVLEGTVRWDRAAGGTGRVRITPQLVRVADDTHLWAGAYDRVLEDIFAVQSDIAQQVIDQLGVTLLDRDRQALEARPTESLAAYQAYLRGMESWGGGMETLNLRVQMFEKAVRLDPEFALAFARLSRAHLRLYWGADITDARLDKARAALDRALELQPEHPVVRLAMGYYHYQGKLDFDRALEQFQAVAAERPSDSEAQQAVALIHRLQGKVEEALRKLEASLPLNPSDPQLMALLAGTCAALRRFEEAERWWDRAIALAPDRGTLYRWKALNRLRWTGAVGEARSLLEEVPATDLHLRKYGSEWSFYFYERDFEQALARLGSHPRAWAALWTGWAYHFLGRPERARASLEAARSSYQALLAEQPWSPFPRSELGLVYALLGRKEEAIREGKRAVELNASDKWDGPRNVELLAVIYAWVGEADLAIDLLARLLVTSYDLPITVPLLRVDPSWDPLRDERAFQALLQPK